MFSLGAVINKLKKYINGPTEDCSTNYGSLQGRGQNHDCSQDNFQHVWGILYGHLFRALQFGPPIILRIIPSWYGLISSTILTLTNLSLNCIPIRHKGMIECF